MHIHALYMQTLNIWILHVIIAVFAQVPEIAQIAIYLQIYAFTCKICKN